MSTIPRQPLTPHRRQTLGRRAQVLAGASVAYNAFEAIVAVSAGVAASSIALVGFGLDSIVEMGSSLVILWQFRHTMPEARERRALRLIAVSFFVLAAYVAFESLRSLLTREAAEPSTLGIAIAALSLVVMPTLCLGETAHRQAAGFAHRRRGFPADAALHVPVRGAADGPAAELAAGLVVG